MKINQTKTFEQRCSLCFARGRPSYYGLRDNGSGSSPARAALAPETLFRGEVHAERQARMGQFPKPEWVLVQADIDTAEGRPGAQTNTETSLESGVAV